jgi:hypothetical protein
VSAVCAFKAAFDIQENGERYFVGARYLNAMAGWPVRRWQIIQAAEVSDTEWAHGASGEWNKRSIDPMWYGRRHPDGSTYDLRGNSMTAVPGYARIDGLANPEFWVENDAARRVFLYVDSVVVSMA